MAFSSMTPAASVVVFTASEAAVCSSSSSALQGSGDHVPFCGLGDARLVLPQPDLVLPSALAHGPVAGIGLAAACAGKEGRGECYRAHVAETQRYTPPRMSTKTATNAHVYTHTYVCFVCGRMYVCMCIYLSIYIYIYVYICAYIYVYLYL